MTSWTADELSRIAAADELELAARRPGGSLRSPVTIWVVCYLDDLYVRSWRGATAGWFRAAQAGREGRMSAGGVAKDVAFEPVSEEGLKNAIDVAYRSKYGRSRYATTMVTEPARSTMLKLVPRAWGDRHR
jgi:hypothetical protein